MAKEVWYTLDSIKKRSNVDEKLYCLSIKSPDKQFQVGRIGVPTHNSNTEEGKMIQEMKGEISLIVGSILRLGRAAGVHMLLATQRPDAKLITGEQKNNLGVRICCGWVNSTASSMILDNDEGTRVNSSVKGRLVCTIYSSSYHGQGLFQGQDWVDKWLRERGLNPDGTPLSSKAKRIIDNKIDELSNTDLDSSSGVNNSEIIAQMRAEEQDTAYAPSPQDEAMGRPDFNSDRKKVDFGRPEDDWDDDLESLIEENHS